MLIDSYKTPRRRKYVRDVYKIFTIFSIFFCLFYILFKKSEFIGGVNGVKISRDFIIFLFIGMTNTLIGYFSYKSGVIGGLGPWFNYLEGKPAKVSALVLMFIGVLFLFLALRIIVSILS